VIYHHDIIAQPYVQCCVIHAIIRHFSAAAAAVLQLLPILIHNVYSCHISILFIKPAVMPAQPIVLDSHVRAQLTYSTVIAQLEILTLRLKNTYFGSSLTV